MVATLRSGGYEVLTTETAVAAFELAISRPIDLIITEVVFRDWTGIELLQELRALGRNTPVLFVSSVTEEQLGDVLAISETRLLHKHPTPQELLLAVRLFIRVN